MRRVVVAAVVAVLLGACSSSGASGATRLKPIDLRGRASGDAYPKVRVAAKDNVFGPNAIRIDPGTTVEWTNEGRSAHDITSSGASGGFGVRAERFDPGATYAFRFDRPGVYRYYCKLHGTEAKGMIGVVIVGNVPFDEGGRRTGATSATKGGTLRVPKDFRTIQAAVDAAEPGSLLLVSPGVYREAVTVSTPNLVIRGLHRATTIVDGELRRDNGFKVLADGVAIENLTARNFTRNGFFWTGVKGYRGSYLNALRNGDYGIYAFDSTHGQFDHDYAAGSPDAGFYIGQCFPCDAVITDSLAEWNGLGYSGTNAGGNLLIVSSTWRFNRAGIVPNSGSGEENPPQHGATIVGNRVYANNNAKTAAIEIATIATGNGILIAGGNDNIVERNLVYDHDIAGIAVVTLPEKVLDPGNEKAQNFDARKNSVRANVLHDNRTVDLALVTSLTDATDTGANCFSDNGAQSSLPANLEQLLPCGGAASRAFTTDLARFVQLLGSPKPAGADYTTVALPTPPRLPDMRDAVSAPPRSASRGVPPALDVNRIPVPR